MFRQRPETRSGPLGIRKTILQCTGKRKEKKKRWTEENVGRQCYRGMDFASSTRLL